MDYCFRCGKKSGMGFEVTTVDGTDGYGCHQCSLSSRYSSVPRAFSIDGWDYTATGEYLPFKYINSSWEERQFEQQFYEIDPETGMLPESHFQTVQRVIDCQPVLRRSKEAEHNRYDKTVGL